MRKHDDVRMAGCSTTRCVPTICTGSTTAPRLVDPRCAAPVDAMARGARRAA